MSAAPAMRFYSLLLLLAAAAPAAGQTTVAASVEPDVAEVGEMVSFSVEVTGDRADDTVVEPPSATGLSLTQRTPVLRTLSIVRGQARLTVRWLYQAERPGSATIGPARVRVGGRTYTTAPIAVTVTDRGQLAPSIPPPTAIPAPDRAGGELFVRAVPRVRRPYTGQQVVVDYVLYFEPHLEPRSAQFIGSWQAEGVWREELEVPREATAARPVTVDGRRYYAVVLRRVAIYPTRSGDVRLGALTFDLELLRGSRGVSPFGFFPRLGARYTHEEVTAPAVELTARPLPPGAPAAFSGAVGRFSMTADLDRADARAGEPLQLTVTVEGTGNVATLAPPAVEAPPSFERFEPREDRTLDARRAPAVGTKTFTYTLMPRAAGRHALGVEFSYFDPEAGAYRTLEAGPFAVAVTGNVLAGAPGSAGPAPPMEAAAWTRARSFSRPGAGWLVAAAFFPLMALAVLLISRRGVPRLKRRRRPAAPDRFAAARAALDDPPAFYAALDAVLAAATPATPEAQAEAAELKKVSERVRYAPGPAPDREARLAHLARAERLTKSVSALPVEEAIPGLKAALMGKSAAVLVAPPGAGKTTRVPLALLDEPWLEGKKIVVLEPRRLAARAAARRMAQTLGEGVGETVGYRVRMETRVGPRTRIEVVTEGILTRMLVADPALDGVGLVAFDEFHERSLQADLGLALALQSRALLRPDLRVLAMSATLDGAAVAALLGDDEPAPVVASEGRAFPVETRWLPRPDDRRADAAVAAAVRRALAEEPAGDVLAFLPGAAEIRRCAALLEEGGLPDGVFVAPLYGDLALEDQDRALVPAPPGRRKVVLATAIAETSLTVEGVRVVVDAGLARRPRFDAPSGMTRLETGPASQAAAEQRRGRAGRTQPGVCYRLWPTSEHAHRAPFDPPEIRQADLAPLALDLAAWGAGPDELRWLDPPSASAFEQARELLRELGALDGRDALTDHGRAMAALPLHPRLAHMALVARGLGLEATAADVAALAAGRDPFRYGPGGAPPDPDLRLRLDALAGRDAPGAAVDRGALAHLRREAQDLRRRFSIAPTPSPRGPERRGGVPAPADAAGLLLALAYPDRIAQRTRPGRFRLRNGRGATLDARSPLADAPFLAVGPLGGAPGAGGDARVFLAAPLTLEEIEAHVGADVETVDEVVWDDATETVRARRVRRLGALVLSEKPLPHPDPDKIAGALLDALRRRGADALPWSKAARGVQARLIFLRHHLGDAWPDVADGALMDDLDDWLGPYLAGARRLADLARLDLAALLTARLTGSQRAELERLAPTHVDVPSGSRLPLDYSDPEAPVLAVRLQEVFGLEETPRLAGGRVPVVMHLLSPAHRPVQITRDLAGFWRSSYFDVRKDLRGRYPKHHWPENPLEATPTARAKRRGE